MASKIGKVVTKPIKFIVGKVIAIVVLVALLGCGVYFGQKALWRVYLEKKHTLVEEQLSRCAELVTIKNRYTDIVNIKKSAALGLAKAYSIVKFTAIIRAGINDVRDIEFEISPDGKTLTVKMPPSEILGNDIVSQEVFDEKKSIFVPITTKEIFEGIDEARSENLEANLTNGILSDASEQARNTVQAMLSQLKFQNIKIEQKSASIF